MIINFRLARASAHLKSNPTISLPDNMQGHACLSAGKINDLYYCQGNLGLRVYRNVMQAMESIALLRIQNCNARASAR